VNVLRENSTWGTS